MLPLTPTCFSILCLIQNSPIKGENLLVPREFSLFLCVTVYIFPFLQMECNRRYIPWMVRPMKFIDRQTTVRLRIRGAALILRIL
jgi:hypothetical protein